MVQQKTKILSKVNYFNHKYMKMSEKSIVSKTFYGYFSTIKVCSNIEIWSAKSKS